MSFHSLMHSAKSSVNGFVQDDTGATAIEYGLIAGLIAAVIVASVTLIGGNLKAVFNGIASAIAVKT